MAKPPTVVGRASQNTSGLNIINKVIITNETPNKAQYLFLDFFSVIKLFVLIGHKLTEI